MESELRYYKVEDPYGKAYSYYKDEYLCLWEVTPDEVVAHWDWDDLIENYTWYEDEILPAFNEHNDDLLRRSQIESTFEMSTLQNALPRVSLVSVSRDTLPGPDLGYLSNSDTFSDEDAYTSREEDNLHHGYEAFWDTDDEAVESNAIDDTYKILEGD